jgi:hypothetical protein
MNFVETAPERAWGSALQRPFRTNPKAERCSHANARRTYAQSHEQELIMKLALLYGGGVLAAAMSLAACESPGVAAGATTGAAGGALVAGPPGAVVGGAAGAVVGGIADANAPRFRTYVIEQRHASAAYSGDVVVGTTLTSTVVVYDVPPEYEVRTYKYAVVNNRIVLVDPTTYRVVQVVG